MAVQYLPDCHANLAPPLRHLPSHSMSPRKLPPISTAQPFAPATPPFDHEIAHPPPLTSLSESPSIRQFPFSTAREPSSSGFRTGVRYPQHPSSDHSAPPSTLACPLLPSPSRPPPLFLPITNPSSAADDLIARPALTFSNTMKWNACLWQSISQYHIL